MLCRKRFTFGCSDVRSGRETESHRFARVLNLHVVLAKVDYHTSIETRLPSEAVNGLEVPGASDSKRSANSWIKIESCAALALLHPLPVGAPQVSRLVSRLSNAFVLLW